MSFSALGSHPGHRVTFSCHTSLGYSWLRQYPSLSLFFFLVCVGFLRFFNVANLSLYWICYNIASVLYFGFLAVRHVGISAPWPGIEPAPPAPEGEIFTTHLQGSSRLSLFSITFFWGSVGHYFIGCPSSGIGIDCLMISTEVMGLGRMTSEVKCLSSHIKGTCYQYDASLEMMTLITWLTLCLPNFSTANLFSPSSHFPDCALWD